MIDDEEKRSHDFRNQLAIILGFSEILLAEAADADPRRGDLEEIHRAAVTALALLARVNPARAVAAEGSPGLIDPALLAPAGRTPQP